MDAGRIQSLIERLEGAGGPDRRLDTLIENYMGLAVFVRDPNVGFGDADYNRREPAPFTASIDAAMKLAPEGWRVQISDWDAEILRARGPWQCIFVAPGGRDNLAEWWPRCDHASSAPLAICSAALKAKIILDADAQ